jgi:hypothetical protein
MRRVQNHLWRFGKVAQIRPKCDQRLEVITKEANRLLPGSPHIIQPPSKIRGDAINVLSRRRLHRSRMVVSAR